MVRLGDQVFAVLEITDKKQDLVLSVELHLGLDPFPLSPLFHIPFISYPLIAYPLFLFPLSLPLVPYPLVLFLSRNLGGGSTPSPRPKTGV